MKKRCIYLFVPVMIFLMTGCGTETKQKETMKKYAVDYYHRYGKQFTEIDEYVVSLKQLKESNKTFNHGYDLSDLKRCQDDSKIIFSVKEGEILNTEYQLHC